jgi:Domain of unknown function (DUF4365)
MASDLTDLTGFRGEKILELRLTDYQTFARPLFRPGFLGDKWPAIDFYVELLNVRGTTPYFFAQVKATTTTLTSASRALKISSKARDIERLLRIPGPTYLFGVHEPSQRVFAQFIHSGLPNQAITRIRVSHELNASNLQRLHDEVRSFWRNNDHKPEDSVFA